MLTPDPSSVKPSRRGRRILARLLSAAVAAAWGCAAFGGLRSEPVTAGRARTFAAHLQQVLDGTRRTADSLGLRIAEYYEPDAGSWGLILTPDATADGPERVTVRVVAVTNWDQSETVVRVLAQPAAPPEGASGTDWAHLIFTGIEREVRAQREERRGGPAEAALAGVRPDTPKRGTG